MKAQGQEKYKVTLFLTIIAEPPLIIFKANDKGKFYKSLNEDI